MSAKWWDESELVLLAHTGDIHRAADFAAWSQQTTRRLEMLTGESWDEMVKRLAMLVEEGTS